MRRLLLTAVLATIPGSPGFCADYAPMDCSKARSPAETTICKTYSLGQAEARMATLYGIATSLVAMGQRGDIQDNQIEWLKTRDACGSSVTCLAGTYDDRIRQLSQIIDGIAAHGPY
jgi:uncharacterized protein